MIEEKNRMKKAKKKILEAKLVFAVWYYYLYLRAKAKEKNDF